MQYKILTWNKYQRYTSLSVLLVAFRIKGQTCFLSLPLENSRKHYSPSHWFFKQHFLPLACFLIQETFFIFFHLPWKSTVTHTEHGLWLLWFICTRSNACAGVHMHSQTGGANTHWCSSAPHFALGYALREQAAGALKHSSNKLFQTCFVFCLQKGEGGGVGAQGILNHKNAEYLSPFSFPPPHLNQRCSWNEIQLSFQTFSYVIQFTSTLIAKLKTDFTPFLLDGEIEMTKFPLNSV